MMMPEPASSRASHPSPSAGRKTTFCVPASCSVAERAATIRSAPPGPSDSIRCAIRSGLGVNGVTGDLVEPDGKRDDRIEHLGERERGEEGADHEAYDL